MIDHANLAPIGLSVYSRLEHIKKTVSALQQNRLADQSQLYIFSDAPRPGDEEKVAEVRSFLKTISGFKKINIVERKENGRVANTRGGFRYLLDKYGKAILLEEDIITAPGFLTFMNEGLEIYRDREDIISICGYTPPANLKRYYDKDIYLSYRFCAWGIGMWKDWFDKILMEKIDYSEFCSDKKLVRKFKQAGEDLPKMLKLEADGKIDALDVKVLYTQAVKGLLTLAPTESLTKNIGLDGTGVHCGKTDRLDTALSEIYNKITHDKNIQQDERVHHTLYCFNSSFPENRLAVKILKARKNLSRYLRQTLFRRASNQ